MIDRLYETVCSAVIWCVVWFVGFVAVAEVSLLLDFSIETSGFVMSITVLIGHLPKLFAILLNTDTDFQGIFSSLGKLRPSNLAWVRLTFALAPVLCLCFYLIPEAVDVLRNPLNPLQLHDLIAATVQNWQICAALFVTQMVFSWPANTNDIDPTEMKNYHVSGSQL